MLHIFPPNSNQGPFPKIAEKDTACFANSHRILHCLKGTEMPHKTTTLLTASDGPMIDFSRKSIGLGFRLRQSIVKCCNRL